MCGRYALFGPTSRNLRHLGIDEAIDWPDRFNIAPTQAAPVIGGRPDGTRQMLFAHWGLRPAWIKEVGKLSEPIIARLESAADKPMFRAAFRHSRCLVPATGFYEWQAAVGRKVPHYIHGRDGEPLAFGGLLEHWHGPDGDWSSYCLLTTAALGVVADIHDRMPVIIRSEHYAAWLDPKIQDPATVMMLAEPFPTDRLAAYAVSTRVNRPGEEGATLVEPVG